MQIGEEGQTNEEEGLRLMTMREGIRNHNQLEGVVKPAQLSRCPRSLQMLWREYKIGLDGNKPAEQFTTRKRNTSKGFAMEYGRRKAVWQIIQRG